MFGFAQPDPTDKTARPVTRPALDLRSVVLVAKEDIYREQVLLAKKGYEVDVDELPKFIQNGATPNQFTIKVQDGEDIPLIPPSADLGMHNPILRPRRQKTVLVLDTDQKSMKRTIDCLFVCGFALNNIHPLRIPAHIDWTLARHRPHIVVVDFDLGEGRNGLDVLRHATLPPGVEQVILTLPAGRFTAAQETAILEVCQRMRIGILHKPVHRAAMHHLLGTVSASAC